MGAWTLKNGKGIHLNLPHFLSNRWGEAQGGYPIGSGGIESANKFICHVRLKRSGAWWLKPNCNSMLKLRCSICLLYTSDAADE